MIRREIGNMAIFDNFTEPDMPGRKWVFGMEDYRFFLEFVKVRKNEDGKITFKGTEPAQYVKVMLGDWDASRLAVMLERFISGIKNNSFKSTQDEELSKGYFMTEDCEHLIRLLSEVKHKSSANGKSFKSITSEILIYKIPNKGEIKAVNEQIRAGDWPNDKLVMKFPFPSGAVFRDSKSLFESEDTLRLGQLSKFLSYASLKMLPDIHKQYEAVLVASSEEGASNKSTGNTQPSTNTAPQNIQAEDDEFPF